MTNNIKLWVVRGEDFCEEYMEHEILEENWETWKAMMIGRHGKNHSSITKENCIKYWAQINNAKCEVYKGL